MFPTTLSLFETALVIGLVCSGGALLTSAWREALPNPSKRQDLAYHWLFSGLFLGFLTFGLTPVFLWLLFL